MRGGQSRQTQREVLLSSGALNYPRRKKKPASKPPAWKGESTSCSNPRAEDQPPFSLKLVSVEEPELLYVSCRACSSPVPTGLRLTAAVYEIPPDEGHMLTCPRCGASASYTKQEFRIRPESIGR